MLPPIILVTTDVRPDGYTWHAAPDRYLKAVAAIGAVPLLLPSLGAALDLEGLLRQVDGVLLTGARSNVHPARYGVEPTERYEPYDLDRDETVFRLIPLAIAAGVPLFAICRGFQELNVALGGTLITEAQERPGSLDHRAPIDLPYDERFKLKHDVTFEADSALGRLVGSLCVPVNSVHRQVIDDLGQGLAVEARAPDGTIEAIRVRDATAFAFGVQWHPEYWAATDAPSGALFRGFGDAARDHAERRLGDRIAADRGRVADPVTSLGAILNAAILTAESGAPIDAASGSGSGRSASRRTSATRFVRTGGPS